MAISPLTIQKDYWDCFEIKSSDIEFIYNMLLELELPQSSQELVKAIIDERIAREKQNLQQQRRSEGKIYAPKEQYAINETILFPARNWEKGRVVNVRKGNNPEIGTFDVIDVEFAGGDQRSFASNLQDHALNQPITFAQDDPNLDPSYVMRRYGRELVNRLDQALSAKPDLVRIAGRWFPRALLVDVNMGHLNLAEAVLEVENGGPLKTSDLLEQIDLTTDVNTKLTEFSLNLALQEDERFDEVGPAGEILWFLHRLEPAEVQSPPIYLKASPYDVNYEQIAPLLSQFEEGVCDELEEDHSDHETGNEVTISLLYPHWRAGTLPLSCQVESLFPTAYESPRVQFTFKDGDSGERFSGWVVRPYHYVFGLAEWYQAQGVFPGSRIHIIRSTQPGEVIIRAEKHRPNREWMRTVITGADGGVVYALLKQLVSTNFDDRMAIMIPDTTLLDQMWEQGIWQRKALDTVVLTTMRELGKLNPQGHIHAQELYAAVNVIRRCPPSAVLQVLVNNRWAIHLGDLYFRLDEAAQEGKNP